MDGLRYITPGLWEGYELLDSGGGEKLECFGGRVLRRPEPQAVWEKGLAEGDWAGLADAWFRRDKNVSHGDERGVWERRPAMPDRWWMGYDYKDMHLRMRLGMTSFKHVGIFPEQAANWDFIYDNTRRGMRVLNLFAYTGGATLAVLAAGGEAVHVDAVKQVVGWARENAAESGLDGARWIVDDALKFVHREERRGNKYDGIILDPPAYGRGPDGEKWILERDISPLLRSCSKLLAPGGYVVFNLYSMGLSALVARTSARGAFGAPSDEEFGELYLADRAAKLLPLGVYFRGIYR